jgi:ATP-dependent DNA helicase RecG
LLRGDALSETGRERLALMRETQDGFRLAEEDLRLRGGGELLGTRQSGDTPFRVADFEQIARLLPLAHDDARLLMERDGGLAAARRSGARATLPVRARLGRAIAARRMMGAKRELGGNSQERAANFPSE